MKRLEFLFASMKAITIASLAHGGSWRIITLAEESNGDNPMMSKMRMTLAASLIGMAALAGAGGSASAAPAGAPLAAISGHVQADVRADVQAVHYRGTRHMCAHRWGWRTRGYYRCLHRHRHVRPIRNYCRATRHECADRWGWRTGRYYRCVRNRGC